MSNESSEKFILGALGHWLLLLFSADIHTKCHPRHSDTWPKRLQQREQHSWQGMQDPWCLSGSILQTHGKRDLFL